MLTVLGTNVMDCPNGPKLDGLWLVDPHEGEEGAEGAVGDHLLLRSPPLANHPLLKKKTLTMTCDVRCADE